MESSDKYAEFNAFVESVKAKISIKDLYTDKTGEQFVEIGGRLRAKAIWRGENDPSLCLSTSKNLLTDFGKNDLNTNRPINYGVIDIFMRCGGAISYMDGVRMACEMTSTELPDKFKKSTNTGQELQHNLGGKIIEIWEACKKHLQFAVENPSKRTKNMVDFFDKRNIPFDLDFLQIINVGACPSRQTLTDILKDSGIFKDDDHNIFKKELEDNGLVFPLYNKHGALCGLRFRRFDVKHFAQWLPVPKMGCFFNGQRYNKRPYDKTIFLVEGEMDLVAYAIAGYKAASNMDDINVKEELSKSLNSIFATGSKGTDVSFFKGELRRVNYFQNHDIPTYEAMPHPTDHKILETCVKVSNAIEAKELLVVDWASLPYIGEKYDLEDYLRYHNYDISSLADVPYISFQRYCVKVIKGYLSSIKDEDIRSENQDRFIVEVANRLEEHRRKSFETICKKEFIITDDFAKQIDAAIRPATCGNYQIDKLGNIVEAVSNKQDHTVNYRKQTNFHLRICNEIIEYNRDIEFKKFYEIEIVINGKNIYKGEIDAADIPKDERVKSFCAETASFTEMVYYNQEIRGKDFSIITNLMQNTPNFKKTTFFSTLCRPMEDQCKIWFNTEKFCLFPKVSIINGEIKENTDYQVLLKGRKKLDQPLFEFRILDEDQFRKAGKLFWYDLRHVHETPLVDTFVALVFESCTREMQGTGIVENSHGFSVYIEGRSGSFKTTAAIASMALLGRFKEQGDVLSWNSTPLARLNHFMSAGNATHMMDDLKVEDLRSKEFAELFHAIYGGSSKAAMESNGKNIRGDEKIKCNVIFTAEGKPSDTTESIASRMLVLRVVRPPDKLKEIYGRHQDVLKELDDDGQPNIYLMHGLMPRMIAWAQKRGVEPYSKSLVKYQKLYEKILGENNNVERPSDMVARLLAAFEQITTFCIEQGICSESDGMAELENLAKFWKIKILDQIKRINTQSSIYKGISLLYQMLCSEGIGIQTYANNKWDETIRFGDKPIMDITYPDKRGRKLIIVSVSSVITAMNNRTEGGFCIIKDKFLQDLREANVIEVDSNGKDVCYPIPNKKTNRITESKTESFPVIDYEKLVKAYEESQ